MAKLVEPLLSESERSVRRWPGQPGNRVEGSIADFWQSVMVSMANRFRLAPSPGGIELDGDSHQRTARHHNGWPRPPV